MDPVRVGELSWMDVVGGAKAEGGMHGDVLDALWWAWPCRPAIVEDRNPFWAAGEGRKATFAARPLFMAPLEIPVHHLLELTSC